MGGVIGVGLGALIGSITGYVVPGRGTVLKILVGAVLGAGMGSSAVGEGKWNSSENPMKK